jgi:DNA polymerase III subunit delta
MPPLTRIALRKQIAAGETGPLYLLIGEDDIEKSAVASEFAEMVDEGLRAFSMDRLFGGEIKADDLFDAAATLPMMAPRRVVIVFDAERLLIPKREGKAADAEQERLEAFVRKPPQHATVVLVCGPLDQRRRLVKLLLKEAQVVDCGSISDSADAERWVKARAERDKVPIDGAAVRVLVERAGIDLVRLRSGLERVALYAMGQPKITADDVKQVVAPTAEATNFGIANAIERNDAATALRELALALEGGAVPFFLMGQLRWVAEKMPPARLKHAIAAVFRTDEAIKSSGGDPKILLERLVVELCATASSRTASRISRPR